MRRHTQAALPHGYTVCREAGDPRPGPFPCPPPARGPRTSFRYSLCGALKTPGTSLPRRLGGGGGHEDPHSVAPPAVSPRSTA